VTRTIVVGVDGSRSAEAAADHAVDLAQGLGDRVVLVFAAETPVRSVGDEWRESQQALEEMGSELLASAVGRAAHAGVEVEAVFVPMRPVEGLLEVAREREARMIVVGTASERPLTGLILGSVPHKLLHRSSVPVLVVPVPEAP
jgi:nucleotide-binding universal stress UspA family protein